MATFKMNLQKPYDVSNDGKKTLSKKETRLYLFVIHDRDNVAKIKTEFTIKPTSWDFKEKRVKHQVTGSVLVNKRIDDFKELLSSEYEAIRKDFPEMRFPEIAANLKDFAKKKISPIYSDKDKPFFVVFDEYIESKRDIVAELTIKKYHSLQKSLQEFQPDITFNKIDMNFYDKYTHYLRTRAPRGRQKTREESDQIGLLNDTTAKYIEGLKNFLKWGYERGIHTNKIYEHSGFKAERKVKNDIVTLYIDELKALYNFDFSQNPRLEKVRDVFCFGCFTGQRWSDIENFSKKDLSGDTWKFESYKTKKEITIPLVGYFAPALDILRKYNYKLPIISPQKFNSYIKDAGEIAGLDRPVQIKRYIGKREVIIENPVYEFMCSHMGRRTAISILLNNYHMPIHMVRDLSGHSTIKMLDKYLDKDSDALRKRLSETTGVNQFMTVLKNDAV